MKDVIKNIKLAIEMSGDGGIKAFTDEEENDMYSLLESVEELINMNPEMLVDAYYPIEIGFMTTSKGRERYCERKAFIKGVKLCQKHLFKN